MLASPTDEAASVGIPAIFTSLAGRSAETSIRRTPPSAKART